MSCRTVAVQGGTRNGHLALCLSLHVDSLCRQRLDSPAQACTSGLHAEVVRFGKGTARIGAAARQQGLGLAVLAQPQGHPTAGAVGGQATGGLGTRGLGQVKSPCGPMQGPPMHNQPHRSLHLFYRERDETARGQEGAQWSGRQEGQGNASSTSKGGENRGPALSITSPMGTPRKRSFTISPPLRPRKSVAEQQR